LAPARWRAVAGAIGTVAVVACGYALLTKVFPATLNAGDAMGRLRAPFDYWNATGLMAALGLPVCLWAGARPRTARVVRSVSVPATAILFTALVLSFSRGAVVAAVIGLAVWFALAPFRLRGALVLVLGAVGAALATFWALSHHPITHDNATLTARTAAGHRFGLVLLAVVVLSALIGVAATFGMERIALRARVRRQIGMALVVLVALVPFVALAGAAASSRGLTGEISHAWHALTSSSGGVGNNPNRLGQLGNSRPIYWREGLKVGEHAPLAGVGAGGFDTARTRYTTNSLAVAHAHSYLIETFADLGLIGVVVSLALLGAWALTCRRALRPVRSDPAGADERAGLITLLAVAVTFGISSLLDWTWFVPGVAVPALVSAGWLVGRGSRTAGAPVAGEATQRPLPLGRAAAGLGIVVALFVAGWFVWQPLHSADQVSAAIDALTHHNTRAALGDARSAAASDPVSVDPLWELSAIYSSLGDPAAARHELVQATRLQPSNPQTWQQLGSFDLLQARRPRVALSELETAQRLDRTSAVTAQLVAQARRALGA
jgi:O-antigen ligase